MSIAVTDNDDTSRVVLTAAGIVPDLVRVETSLNETHWALVRGGVEIDSSTGSIALSVWEFAAGSPNHYRVVNNATDAVLETASIVPDLDGQIWLKSILWPSLNRPIVVQTYGGIGRAARGGLFAPKGRSLPIHTMDVAGSQQFTLTLATNDIFPGATEPAVTQARTLDLILATGHVFLVHVPPERAGVPGGYVTIGTTDQDRIVRAGDTAPRLFQLPCTAVAAPGPDVEGATMTYAALLNLYGDYNGLLVNPTYASLLALMADPEDFVFP